MFCSNCGNRVEENSKFCSRCGNKLESNIQYINNYQNANIVPNYSVNNVVSNVNYNKKKVPVLSWVSLSLLLAKVFIIAISYLIVYGYSYNSYSGLVILNYLPLLTGSLVTSIVSRAMNKDIMSLVVMIVDIVLIVLGIIIAIIVVIAFSSLIYACGNYNGYY